VLPNNVSTCASMPKRATGCSWMSRYGPVPASTTRHPALGLLYRSAPHRTARHDTPLAVDQSRHTIKSEAKSIYRKLGASTRGQAVTRARELGSWTGDDPAFHPIGVMEPAPARSGMESSAAGGGGWGWR
jgi:hypothetical protein